MDIYRFNDYTSFADSIIKASAEKINNCYQCKKCSAGCSIAFAMDILPHQIIRFIQLGMEENVLCSKTIWLCIACETCGTRCPNEINLSNVIDSLKQRALKSKYNIAEKEISAFHKEFLTSVKAHGRVFEPVMMLKTRIQSGKLMKYIFSGTWNNDVRLAIKMLLTGKMKLIPQRIKNKKDVKKIFRTYSS